MAAPTFSALQHSDLTHSDEDDHPTAGERLLYTLGQLYRHWHRGELSVSPQELDVLDVARLVGVASDIEMVTESYGHVAYHLPGEVLLVSPKELFPWRLSETYDYGVWLLLCDATGLLDEAG